MIDSIDAILAEHDQTAAERGSAFLADAMVGLIGPPVWDPVQDAEAIQRLERYDRWVQALLAPPRLERSTSRWRSEAWASLGPVTVGDLRRWMRIRA